MRIEIEITNGGIITVQSGKFVWVGADGEQAAEIACDCINSRAVEVGEFESTPGAEKFELGAEKSSDYFWAVAPKDLLAKEYTGQGGRAGRAMREAIAGKIGYKFASVDWEVNDELFWDSLPQKLAKKIPTATTDGVWLSPSEIETIQKTPYDSSGADMHPVIISDEE